MTVQASSKTRPILYLVRGMPGSGKTTFAKSIGCLLVEADQLCVRGGVYRYDHVRMARAHAWCLRQVQEAIGMGMDVAVANNFQYLKFIEPYIEISKNICCDVTIVECTREYGSPHRIPRKVVEKMRATWEPIPAEWTRDMRMIVVGGWNAADEKTRTGSENAADWFAVAVEHVS